MNDLGIILIGSIVAIAIFISGYIEGRIYETKKCKEMINRIFGIENRNN